MSLSPDLLKLQTTIERYAREFGLDFFEVRFEMLDYRMMNQVAAYDGFPTRYPHWRFGMEYERLSKSYAYGLHRIYEMVINTNPCYAYLLASNQRVDQKLVIAHVMGHADFFKNNQWFAHTNRKMLDEMANHAARIRRHVERHGLDCVEDFLDACLSLDNLIDIHSVGIRRRPLPSSEDEEPKTVHKLPAKAYMDAYINPPEFLAEQQRQLEAAEQQRKRFPEEPERDVLLFLLEHAPLDNWQHDVLDIVREEAYYFAPQRQTKIMNEGWACATGDALLITEKGILTFKQLYDGHEAIQVDSGPQASTHAIAGFHKESRVPTLRITTRRGLTLEGAWKHRVQLADGNWIFLKDIRLGDRVAIARGSDLWPEHKVRLAYQASSLSPNLNDVAAAAGVSAVTVHRHLAGRRTRSDQEITAALNDLGYQPGMSGKILSNRRLLKIPEYLNENLAYILGAWVGDGHRTKSGVAITSGDEEHARYLARLIQTALGVPGNVRWDPTKQGGRWRVEIHSRELQRFLLTELGMALHALAPAKQVPPAILRSPRTVVVAFLQGYFDADAYAGPEGVILSSASRDLIHTVQVILLNLGILSRQRPQADGCIHLEIKGQSAALFQKCVGFKRLARQNALAQYVAGHQWFKREDETDEIVAIAKGEADVYDITVAESHMYTANGLINHNSFAHTRIMTERALEPNELIDYAEHHSGTVAVHPGRLNPYKLGLELYRDIEDRWNRGAFGSEYEACESMQARREWDRKLGLGRQKVFEVRRVYGDIGFIDEFLTEDFAREHKLFTFDYNEDDGQYEIASREFQAIKRRLLFQLTNFGQPIVEIVDGNYQNRGELYLFHRHEGIDLDVPFAQDTLRNLYTLWGRPVHVETQVEDEGRVLFSHGPDGGARRTLN